VNAPARGGGGGGGGRPAGPQGLPKASNSILPLVAMPLRAGNSQSCPPRHGRRCGIGRLTLAGDSGSYLGEWVRAPGRARPRARVGAGSLSPLRAQVDDVRCGKGSWTTAKKDVYVGAWRGGVREGEGRLVMSDGSWYKGEFRADAYHGKGVMQFVTKDVYDGAWACGKQHGRGTLTPDGGTADEGYWFEGQRLGGVLPEAEAAFRARGGRAVSRSSVSPLASRPAPPAPKPAPPPPAPSRPPAPPPPANPPAPARAANSLVPAPAPIPTPAPAHTSGATLASLSAASRAPPPVKPTAITVTAPAHCSGPSPACRRRPWRPQLLSLGPARSAVRGA
jgi:hypothetical protein